MKGKGRETQLHEEHNALYTRSMGVAMEMDTLTRKLRFSFINMETYLVYAISILTSPTLSTRKNEKKRNASIVTVFRKLCPYNIFIVLISRYTKRINMLHAPS
jgi:hypothetical protein|uniref:Uncharacterized protein n=1 Tax=Sipha flava TaxID=143950 RepID=A0A2S2QWB1_9HEMI